MVSVERKYDGEYCQIHVSQEEADHHITIFSKSGRDFTFDRIAIHDAIRKCLGIGAMQSKFERQCILEGEMLVYSDRTQQIMPFYKIRKYVPREGRYLGYAQDSPTSDDEHLMIMFYDVLLVDDILCIHEPHDQRRQRLQSLIQPIPGRADIGTRETINFRIPVAPRRLCEAMASAITQGWEGLVMEICQDPYVSLHKDVGYVKLKKDYIPGLGDSADLIVVGGRRDAKDVQMLRIGNLSWTTFYLACLENKDEVRRFDAKPRFRVVGSVGRPCLSVQDIRHLNDHGKLQHVPFARRRAEMDVWIDFPRPDQPTELFKKPVVVEVIGAGFEKPADVNFFTLRFPRIQKVHGDRPFRDALSFSEYQRLAKESRASTENEDKRVKKHWVMKLGARSDGGNPRYDSVTSRETTQNTESTNSSSDTESLQSITPSKLDLIDKDRPAVNQTRTASIEIADSQNNTISSNVVSLKRKILSGPRREISPPHSGGQADGTGITKPREHDPDVY